MEMGSEASLAHQQYFTNLALYQANSNQQCYLFWPMHYSKKKIGGQYLYVSYIAEEFFFLLYL